MKKISYKQKNFNFELRNIRETNGHDDSIPFNADVYLNDNKIGVASNDGWGGDADITITTTNTKDIEDYKKFKELVENTTWKILEMDNQTKEIKYNIYFLADLMVFQALVGNKTTYINL